MYVVALLGKIRQSFQSVLEYFSDSFRELKKVKWPNRKEMVGYTTVVLTTVAFIAVYFWILDSIISFVLRFVLE